MILFCILCVQFFLSIGSVKIFRKKLKIKGSFSQVKNIPKKRIGTGKNSNDNPEISGCKNRIIPDGIKNEQLRPV